MRDRISILVDYVPKYGEILLGIGCIALENDELLLENVEAREEIKEYLLKQAAKDKNLWQLSTSQEFQRIMHKYIGKSVNIGALRDSNTADKIVNIYMLDFFNKTIWPIIINRYMDNICEGIDKIEISINVKKSVYLIIYGEDNPDLFFSEFKDFLLCNYIIISKATVQENGDILLKVMIPIPPHMQFGY